MCSLSQVKSHSITIYPPLYPLLPPPTPISLVFVFWLPGWEGYICAERARSGQGEGRWTILDIFLFSQAKYFGTDSGHRKRLLNALQPTNVKTLKLSVVVPSRPWATLLRCLSHSCPLQRCTKTDSNWLLLCGVRGPPRWKKPGPVPLGKLRERTCREVHMHVQSHCIQT